MTSASFVIGTFLALPAVIGTVAAIGARQGGLGGGLPAALAAAGYVIGFVVATSTGDESSGLELLLMAPGVLTGIGIVLASYLMVVRMSNPLAAGRVSRKQIS